jgi:hypothetical protein
VSARRSAESTGVEHRRFLARPEGIRRSGIPLDDVFIETKIWISD